MKRKKDSEVEPKIDSHEDDYDLYFFDESYLKLYEDGPMADRMFFRAQMRQERMERNLLAKYNDKKQGTSYTCDRKKDHPKQGGLFA